MGACPESVSKFREKSTFRHSRLFRPCGQAAAVLCLLASFYGLALIYSATYSYNTAQYVDTQFTAVCLGTVGYLAVAAFDMRRVARFYVPLSF